MLRVSKAAGFAALVLVCAGVGTSAQAPAPTPDVLAELEPGLWEFKELGRTATPERRCLTSLRGLLQPVQPRLSCKHFIAENAENSATVAYDCAARGQGRTAVRVETPRLVRVDSQGIADAAALAVVAPLTPPPSAAGPPASPPTAAAPPTSPPTAAGPALALPIALELGASVTGHWARAPSYLDTGLFVYAGARINNWLIGLGLRWDALALALHPTQTGLEGESAGASLWLARTLLERRGLALEFGGSGQLLVSTQEHETTDEREIGRSTAEFWLGVHSRLLLLPSSLRPTIALDAALAPTRLHHSLTLYQKLPTWSVGVALGVAWRPN